MGGEPAPPGSLTANRIGFLVGFPRSGTTLADTFLAGHSQCLVLEELPLLTNATAALGSVDGLPDVEKATIEAARTTYLQQIETIVGDEHADLVIDKFPLNMLAAPFIYLLFPASPIIFVQRHPCDAVISGFMQSFEPNVGMASFLEIEDAAEFFDRVMSVWQAARKSLDLNVHTLVYEELVQDPEATMRPLIASLGLEWDEALLDHRTTAKRRGTLLNTSYNQVVEPLGNSSIGRWRRYREQLEPVLPLLMPWAEQLGYGRD